MKVEVRETGEWKRELLVEVPLDEVREMKQVVLRELQKKANLPGFRKGKVPESIIVQQFGATVDRELVNRLVPKAYKEAIAETKLDPLAPGRIRDVEYRPNEPLTFAAEVEIKPVITIPDYDDLEATKRLFEVPESDIDDTLDVLRDKNAEWVATTRVSGHGDKIKLTLRDVTEDRASAGDPASEDEETEIELGTAGMLPEFKEALTGVRTGDERDIELTYPAEMEREELRGLHRKFHVRVIGVEEKKLPPLDETFASALGYASVEELRQKVRESLESDEEQRSQRELEETLIEQLIQRQKFEAPESMVRNLLENVARDYKIPEEEREAFVTSQRVGGERHVKRFLLLDAVSRQEALTATEEEAEAEVRKGIEDEREASRAVRKARQSGEMDRLRSRLRERKALDFLLGKADIEVVRAPRPEGTIVPGA